MPDSGKIVRSEAEWRALLTEEQFRITRLHGTERAFTGPHLAEKSPGMYHCICCGAPLFASGAKYESGSGWPSFYEPAGTGAVSEHGDSSFMMRRTEVRCASCDAHLGHVFADGPQPTGLRYCINGGALSLKKDKPVP